MQLNTAIRHSAQTHEGGPTFPHMTPEMRLRRSVASCLLWEDQFYEDGASIADRIQENAKLVPPKVLADLAVEAREQMSLRHAPLLLLECLTITGRGTSLVSDTIERVIQRADELSEFMAIYWRNGKHPLSAQMKKGLAKAFAKFDAYQLAKYNRGGAIKLRDVMFMVHPKPRSSEREALQKKLAQRSLESPDTWEVNLSGGADKRETFERMLREGKLGYLALLRNLRNMADAGVDTGLIRDAILTRHGAKRVLPFRYVAAARACPQMEPAIDQALSEAISEMPPLSKKTAVLVDVSASMFFDKVSKRSDMTRMDAAAALASVIHGDLRVLTFSEKLVEIPPRRGVAGVDAVIRSQHSGGTHLGAAIETLNKSVAHDRLIVITDEQSHDRVPDPVVERAYMINVASYQNGVGYGKWTHIDGFSESVIRYIHEIERHDAR